MSQRNPDEPDRRKQQPPGPDRYRQLPGDAQLAGAPPKVDVETALVAIARPIAAHFKGRAQPPWHCAAT